MSIFAKAYGLITLCLLFAACRTAPSTQAAAQPPSPPATRTTAATVTLTPFQETVLPPANTPPPSPTPLPPSTAPATAAPATATPQPQPMTFAVVGDYGLSGSGSQAVADLVSRWNPDLVLTLGDNNYPDGAAGTIADNITTPYGRFIADDRFFPVLGNHDMTTDYGRPYLDYFDLPGNERYYDFVRGDVHFFALNSDWREPDGIGASSRQAEWLHQALASSTAAWQVVYFHAAPYVSMEAKQVPAMRWPFAEWGADLVLSGHAHLYERLQVDNIPYLVNGLGGAGIYLFDESVLPESQFRFNGNYGALFLEASASELSAKFVTPIGTVVDQLSLSR